MIGLLPASLLAIPWFRAEALKLPLPRPFELFGERIEFPPTFDIHPFGLLVATGVITGALVARWRARKMGVDEDEVASLAGFIIVFGFTFGHVLDAIFYHPDRVAADPLFVLQLWNGLSSFGGFIGACLGALAWRAYSKRSFIRHADPIAWSFPFGWLFGRTGCFVVHDHPGRATDFFLGVADYHLPPGNSPPWQTRHDLGLYEVIWSLAMIGLFLYLSRKERRAGFYLVALPILYAPVRFGLDFLRGDDFLGHDPRYGALLTPGHLGAGVLFALGVGLLLYLRWWGDKPLEEAGRWDEEEWDEEEEERWDEEE